MVKINTCNVLIDSETKRTLKITLKKLHIGRYIEKYGLF